MKLNLIKPFLLFFVGVALISCVNEEYDLEKEMDNEITVLKNLTVPVGDLGMLKLGDLIALEEASDLLCVNENGDYYLHLAGDTFEETFKTDGIAISTDDFTTEPIIINFPAFTLVPGYQFAYSDLVGAPFTSEMDIEIDSELTSMIEDIQSIDCDIHIGVSFSINKGSFYLKPGFRMLFPEDLHFLKENASDDFFKIENGNVISITKECKVSADNLFNVNLKLDQIRIPSGAFKNGAVNLAEHIELEGDFYVKTDDFTSAPGSLSIEILPSVQVLNISSVTAKLNINEQIEGTTITVPELPDFFSGSDVVLDFFNPQISLNVTNTLPLSFSLGSSIVAQHANGNTSINPFGEDSNARLEITGDADNRYIISRREVDNAEGYRNIINSGIGNLLKTIPESIGIEYVSVTSTSDDFITFNLDGEYKIALGYEVTLPLAFDKDALIAFTYDISDLDLVFEAMVGSAELNLEMTNSIPLGFEVKAHCLDSEGNVSSSMEMNVDGKILAGSHESPTSNNIRISLKNNADTFELAGLRLSLKAAASDNHVGISLNENQGLEINNISMSIPDGITIDLGKTMEE